MLERAEDILIQHCTLKKVAIAVSGGADSMALMDYVFFSRIVDENDILVVNVNHKIRGETSDRDSSFVKAKCDEFGLRFRGVCVDVPKRCAASGRSVELEAREARRELFTDLVKSGVVDMVLVAHHAQDNAETILMRALRGTGIKGLAGMKIYSENSGILRPFLTTEKCEIMEYIRRNDIEYVTDESNSDDRYDRNFIRLKLMPLIQSRWQGAQKALNRLGNLAAQTSEIVDSALDKSNICFDGEFVKIKIDALKNDAISAAYIALAIKKLGVTEDVYSKNIEEVIGLLKSSNGAKVCVGQGYSAIREYDFITIGKDKTKNSTDILLEMSVSIGVNVFDNMQIELKKVDAEQAAYYKQKLISGDKSALLFDYSKLPSGAVIRYRRDGDIFEQFGGGVKKLKEFLINKKIPVRLRDKIPLICYNNKVLVIVGVEISKAVKCEDNCCPAIVTII